MKTAAASNVRLTSLAAFMRDFSRCHLFVQLPPPAGLQSSHNLTSACGVRICGLQVSWLALPKSESGGGRMYPRDAYYLERIQEMKAQLLFELEQAGEL